MAEHEALLWMDGTEDMWGLVILEWRAVTQAAVSRNVRHWGCDTDRDCEAVMNAVL